MIHLTVDGKAVAVDEGATVLAAAEAGGSRVPTLCHAPGVPAQTSCMLCVVTLSGSDRFVPACTALAEAGMVVTTDSARLREARRTALDLLLSDHVGDCDAPCQRACPVGLDVPGLLARISGGDLSGAARQLRAAVILPEAVARLCPAPCEKGCRRAAMDGAVAIRRLETFLAARVAPALAGDEVAEGSIPGKVSVAIIGAGAAGLACAATLALQGVQCLLIDRRDRMGGDLGELAAGDVAPILDVGVHWTPGVEVHAGIDGAGAAEGGVPVAEDSSPCTLSGLLEHHDLVVLATGSDEALADAPERVIRVDRGLATRSIIHAVAAGKRAATAAMARLRGADGAAPPHVFHCSMGRLSEAEQATLRGRAANAEASSLKAAPQTHSQAAQEADRCMRCACIARDDCRLREHAAACGARQRRFSGRRRLYQTLSLGVLDYEPGKCISCGLCVRKAEQVGDPVGMAFLGRGFDMQVGLPPGDAGMALLEPTAVACAGVCPTGALSVGAAIRS